MLWETTHVLEVVGLNPGTVYWMDMTFFHIDLLLKLYCLFEKTKKINEKEAGVGPFYKKVSQKFGNSSIWSRWLERTHERLARSIFIFSSSSYQVSIKEMNPQLSSHQILILHPIAHM